MIEVVTTDDGSSSLFSDRFDTLYHSSRGAIGEAHHVFIRFLGAHSRVLEVGMGSGLNALLALQSGVQVDYTAIELYPIEESILPLLSFDCSELRAIHCAPWGERVGLTPSFSLLKLQVDLLDFKICDKQFDLIFFDAFDPEVQPEMWSVAIFTRLYAMLAVDGALLTYCAKGVVKRALREAGFTVHRLPGALGKHHMLLAKREDILDQVEK